MNLIYIGRNWFPIIWPRSSSSSSSFLSGLRRKTTTCYAVFPSRRLQSAFQSPCHDGSDEGTSCHRKSRRQPAPPMALRPIFFPHTSSAPLRAPYKSFRALHCSVTVRLQEQFNRSTEESASAEQTNCTGCRKISSVRCSQFTL